MKSWLGLTVACAVMALPLGWSGCSSTGGEGSETHFVKCETDSDCAEASAGDLCVDRRCTATPKGTGGAAPVDGGTGGTPSTGGRASTGGTLSTGGRASTGGAAPAPGACDLPSSGTPLPLAYSVSFHFEKRSNAPVAILEECYRYFEIFGCADGYASGLPYSADYAGLPSDSCKRECPDTTCGCIGACQLKLTPVTSDTPVEESWDGALREKDDISFSSCGCVNTGAASPGRYRVRIPVYPAGGDYNDGPSYHASFDFVLGDQPEVSVTVPLDEAPP